MTGVGPGLGLAFRQGAGLAPAAMPLLDEPETYRRRKTIKASGSIV